LDSILQSLKNAKYLLLKVKFIILSNVFNYKHYIKWCKIFLYFLIFWTRFQYYLPIAIL
jgi:hypothetical protein